MASEATKRALEALSPFEPVKKPKTQPVRIEYNGQFVSLSSGKKIWNTAGHAKTALRNHVSTIIQINNDLRFQLSHEEQEQAYQDVLKAVKIVPVKE